MVEGEEHSKVSRINLIDLAGSERSSIAMTSGIRLKVWDSTHTHTQLDTTDTHTHTHTHTPGRSQHQSITPHAGEGDIPTL